ncbi:sterol desaturase family protein [Actinomadura kijaniata]|uniref:sterol desaturase family protein n=1 Tax=Actinomadura kijaniata TaxID=46161 RepID=UPI000A5120EF|nr:sterol desaturase family protein [Actinomadura kijaniata]
MSGLSQWARELDLATVTALSLAFNFALTGACVVAGGWLARRSAVPTVSPPVTRFEVGLAVVTTVLNAGVAVAGWWLWRHGILRLEGFTGPGVLVELVGFTLVMDAAMYVGHAAAHHRTVYALVHRLHHRFDDPRPLTLFALHPLEVLGFGGMWLAVLSLWTISGWALAGYVVLNAAFGTLGHLGVEPLPARLRRGWLFRWVATPSFHAGHHADGRVNLGFYTTIWDRLFGTIDPTYDETRRAPTPAVLTTRP